MPWQLIYTSAPRGLLSGQTGFCTVARSGDLREALVQRLEQISSYHYLRVAEAATANRNPTVCAFRMLDIRGSKYHVLTRIVPCGLDFTSRTNHLAHHLIFQADELSQLPSPAAILRNWNGWLSTWQGEPRLLEDPALNGFGAAAKSCLPAQTWLRLTGDAGRAAGLLESECIRGCYLLCPPGSEGQVLEMFCETLQLLNLNGQYALRPWRHPFTTFLQAEDNPADFQWRACQEGTPAYQQAVQRTGGLMPLRSVRVPGNSLVKVAREGLKPPSPPSPAAASSHTTTLLRRQPPGKKQPVMELTDTGHWRKPLERPEKPAFLDINFSVNSSSLVRIGIFVAVLAILLFVRHRLFKKPSAPESAPEPVPAQTTPAPAQTTPAPPAHAENAEAPVAVQPAHDKPLPHLTTPPDPAQLNGLSGDIPTYVFPTANLTSFNLPVASIGRFQHLINDYDILLTRPSAIQLSLNTNEWGFSTGMPLTVNGMHEHVLSAQETVTGLGCSFDYSDWKSTPNNLVAVVTTFSTPPQAFSVQFGFSNPTNGDPFRLLIINTSSPPAPLRLGTHWLKANCQGLVASLQPPLDERLGNFRLLGRQILQLQPFIKIKDKRQPLYLYQDWPSDILPPWGDELDFAEARKHLTDRLTLLIGKARLLAEKLGKQTELPELNKPLGKYLGLTNKSLTSYASYVSNLPAKPSRKTFVAYLNSLKKHAEIRNWLPMSANDEEPDLADKFQQIYNGWDADSQSKLVAGNTNYFAFVWQNLKEIEKTRQDLALDRNEFDKLNAWLDAVPGTLDEVAYVKLLIIDPPRPSLENDPIPRTLDPAIMITLTQAERLVRKIAEVVGQPASDTQTAKLAQDYADLCRAANRRLEQCAIMIEAGQFLQAMQLAETPPPLLDLITVLSFRQAAEWRTHCQTHQLPWSEPFYDKYVRLLNSTYGKGIASDHAFYRDYRRAVMNNDDERALSILRVIARMNPSDQNTKEELKRQEEKMVRLQLDKLRQIVAMGDSAATQAQVAAIENSGVPVPSNHPIWQQAQVARCQELLRRAAELRQQDAWQDAEVVVEEIHTLATHYNVQLPAADADAWSSLEGWTMEKRGAYAEDQDFKRALSALEYEVQTIETKRATATPLGVVDARNNFNTLAGKWSEADRFGRSLDEALIARCEQCRDWLQSRMKAASLKKRIVTVAVTLLVLGAIAATIPFVFDWAKERDLVLRLGMLESSRHVADTAALVEQVPARLKTKPTLTGALAKAQNFITHENELNRAFTQILNELQQLAKGGFSSEIEQVGPRRAQAESALKQLAPEFKINGQSALNAWDTKWQAVRNAALGAQLDRAEQVAADLNGTNGFVAVHAAILKIQSMLEHMVQLTNEPPELDRNLAVRFGELSAKAALWTGHGEQWQKTQAALTDAQSLDEYLDHLGQLSQSPFATAAQRDGAAEIDRLKINKETLLGELLVPNDHAAWSALTNNTAQWRTTLMPEQPTAQEKEVYFKLRDDTNMQNVYIYMLITNARPNNEYQSHHILVQGTMARNRTGEMAGLVYDPRLSPDSLRFVPKSYSDWDYASVNPSSRIQECQSFSRIGLGELLDSTSGNYQKPILQLLDQLDQDKSSALFRAYVSLKLFTLAEMRPEEWGLQWSPSAARHIQALKEAAPDLKSGDWMVLVQNDKYETTLSNCFEHMRGISLEKQAQFLQQLASATCAAGFTYAGFIDAEGRPMLRQINPSIPEYWGWDSGSRSVVLLLRKSNDAAALEKLAEPLPCTPLFTFNGDRRRLLNETVRSTSYSVNQITEFLPPFFAGLYNTH